MQFGPKFGMSKKEHLWQSDIFVKPEIRAILWQHLPFFLFLGRRTLDKKLTDHAIWAKIWYVEEGTSLTIGHFCQCPAWKPEIRAILWQHLPFFLFLGRRTLDKKLTDHAIWAKIWYVEEGTSLTIGHFCQCPAPPGNQKSGPFCDSIYPFSCSWEGEH